jgi:hypothetical protein
MSASPENRESFLIPEEEWPVVEWTLQDRDFSFRWDDTVIRTFYINDGEFDYILHRASPEECILIMCNDSKDKQKLAKTLVKNRFKLYSSPFLEEGDLQTFEQSLKGTLISAGFAFQE